MNFSINNPGVQQSPFGKYVLENPQENQGLITLYYWFKSFQRYVAADIVTGNPQSNTTMVDTITLLNVIVASNSSQLAKMKKSIPHMSLP